MDQVLCVVIEGVERRWGKNTITTEEIAILGEWDISEGVMGVFHDGTERPVEANEVIQLDHHKSFKRKPFSMLIEGRKKGWHKETITTEEIAFLGGWEVSVGVIEVSEDNSERTLAPGEQIRLEHHEHHHEHHHKSFGKKHRWKRG
jgi:hypothetical protein